MTKKNTKTNKQLYTSERVESTDKYTLARLNKGDNIWYIIFYAWSELKKQKVRKRIYLSEGTSKQKAAAAEKLIEEIDKLLLNGYEFNDKKELYLPKKQEDTKPNPTTTKANELYNIDANKIKFLEAIHKAMALKKNEVEETTYKNYVTLHGKLLQWANDNGVHTALLKDINEQHIFHFLDTQLANNIANKTYNNILTDLSALFNVFCKRKIIAINPCLNVSKLLAETGKHLAYTNEQIELIKNYLIDNKEFQLLNYVQFIYYSLARPKEVRLLKIGDIDLKDRKIKIASGNAKNKKGQFVRIPDGLYDVISAMELEKYPMNYYVFSAKGNPALEAVGRNYFYKKHRKMLDKLAFTDGHTLYGYKHTAVTNLYYANVEMRYITEQCRHSSEYQTRIYLRALGLFRNEDIEKKYPKF